MVAVPDKFYNKYKAPLIPSLLTILILTLSIAVAIPGGAAAATGAA